MAFKFPFTNYHELNLTWVLEQLKKLFEDSEENVETIESYENRLSAVETELPTVEATAEQAATTANAAASLAQTAKSTSDTANENALTASAQAGLARQEAATAEAEAQAATQAAQQAQATAQNFNGRITQAEADASEALQEAQSFENRVNAAINTANNAANTATIAQGIAVNANQNAATALDAAQIADGKAEAAQDAADIADGKAEAAQDAADIADGKAEAAQDTADLADEKADTNAANIGNLANLTTTAKNNLVAAINEAAQSSNNTNCAPIIINTASGTVAKFTDGADNRHTRKLIGTIETAEGGSGWTGANIYHTGKNLIKALYEGRTNAGVTYTVDANGIISLSGIATGSSYAAPNLSGDYTKMQFFKAGTYTLRGGVSSNIRLYFGGVYVDGSPVTSIGYDTGNGLTYTFPKDFYTYPQIVISSGTDTSGIIIKPTLYLDSTSSEYEPYKGDVIAISWQDVAGAILNGMFTLNEDGSMDVVNSGTGNSYHLTDIGSLITYFGVNNIWTDTGAITECNYPADTKLYIDGKVAELQALILEN